MHWTKDTIPINTRSECYLAAKKNFPSSPLKIVYLMFGKKLLNIKRLNSSKPNPNYRQLWHEHLL